MKTAIVFLLVLGLVPLFAFPAADQKEGRIGRKLPVVCRRVIANRVKAKLFLEKLCHGKRTESEHVGKHLQNDDHKRIKYVILKKLREHLCKKHDDDEDPKEEEANHKRIKQFLARLKKSSTDNHPLIRRAVVGYCKFELLRQCAKTYRIARFVVHKLKTRYCEGDDDDKDASEEERKIGKFLKKKLCEDEEDEDEDDDEE